MISPRFGVCCQLKTLIRLKIILNFPKDRLAYQPDIIFISNDNANIIGEKNIQGAPDMVIEILSPETAYYDLREKFRVFEECGIKEYWIVDPGLKKIEIYENQDKKFKIYSEAEGEGVVSSKLLDGLSISLIEIF